MIKRLLLLILMATVGLTAAAQGIKVTGFDMRNDVVEIHYYADVPQGVKLSNFRVYATINGESREIHNLSGDLETLKASGNKVIYWDCFKDMASDNISGNISFKITCTQQGVSSRYKNPNAFNVYFEYAFTPSTPVTFGMGMGSRVGIYGRVGSNIKKGYEKITSWSAGLYVITFKWLNLNAGYNEVYINGTGYPGYEVGATVLFGRKKLWGINGGYIGSFQNSRYGEYYVGLTLNWNTGS